MREASDMLRRRHALKFLAGLGLGNAMFQRAVAAELTKAHTLTTESLRQAEWISGVALSEDEREELLGKVDRLSGQLGALRAFEVDPQTIPAVRFEVGAGARPLNEPVRSGAVMPSDSAALPRPVSDTDLAFLPVTELSVLLRTRQVSATELTRCYLDRLKTHHAKLRCVVTLMEDHALEQAARADAEIAAGRYRGPLHGVPWGAKDLIAYPGYPTTWGAPQYRERVLSVTATVARRLDQAGAVLVAKLSLGALAMGDQWYGGLTRNPWNPAQGSSGSSAGSASATVAGLVGFALGSETLGSIVSPSRRCGCTGLRPTFGRVSRHGCMALSWTMDKIGPMTRSVEDAALVFGAIHGADGMDPTAMDAPFSWPNAVSPRSIRVGYVEGGDEKPVSVLKDLGFTMVPVNLPNKFPVWEMMVILTAEAATAFHDIAQEGVTEGLNTWPGEFRRGRFISAVDYLRANQIRRELIQSMEDLFEGIDVLLGGGRDELGISNLTGNPTVVMPGELGEPEGDAGIQVPGSLTMTGRWFGESALMQVAHAYQQHTGYHLARPPQFG